MTETETETETAMGDIVFANWTEGSTHETG